MSSRWQRSCGIGNFTSKLLQIWKCKPSSSSLSRHTRLSSSLCATLSALNNSNEGAKKNPQLNSLFSVYIYSTSHFSRSWLLYMCLRMMTNWTLDAVDNGNSFFYVCFARHATVCLRSTRVTFCNGWAMSHCVLFRTTTTKIWWMRCYANPAEMSEMARWGRSVCRHQQHFDDGKGKNEK